MDYTKRNNENIKSREYFFLCAVRKKEGTDNF
jgi:hypothetical protein